MKTIQLNLYPFGELSDKAKEKAIKNHADINVFFDWWQFTCEDFARIGGTFGLTIDPKQIYFRGFYSQGDGSAFTATVDISEMVSAIKGENWKTYAPLLELNFPALQIDERIIGLIKEGKLDLDAKIEQPRRSYYVNASLNQSLPYNGHTYSRIEEQLEHLEEYVKQVAETLNRFLYKTLQDEHEYLSGEQAVIETIEANDYWFTADGETATRIEHLAIEQ